MSGSLEIKSSTPSQSAWWNCLRRLGSVRKRIDKQIPWSSTDVYTVAVTVPYEINIRLGRFCKKSAALRLVSVLASVTISISNFLALCQSLSNVITTGISCHRNGNSAV